MAAWTKWKKRRWQQVFEVVCTGNDGAGVTRAEIAKALGLSKSAYLTALIEGLVEAGHSEKVWDDDRPHPAFVYKPKVAAEAAA